MLAVDHGYFQGPTTGPRAHRYFHRAAGAYADALMITRGALRTSIPG
jgi:putative autoinducer-2 (AI-2) aldolase